MFEGTIHQLKYFSRLNIAILLNCIFSHAHYIE